MSVRARALFFISLALVAGQLDVVPSGSSASLVETTAPDLQPVEAHNAPHPASSGVRSWLPDRQADKLIDAVLVPPQAATVPPVPVAVEATRPWGSRPSAGPLLLLPPSRAPPALS